MRRWSPGDAIVVREVWHGRVFEARPSIVVQDEPDQTVLVVPGNVSCGVPIGEDGAELRLPDRPWDLVVRERRDARPILSFAWPGTPYAVLRWVSKSETPFWYVNLQEPLRRTTLGFDTVDHALDVIVQLDGSWSWKDEDELAEAAEQGLFTLAQVEGFRADGERAVERILRRHPPFDRDWSGWSPDPSWPEPILVPGWDGSGAEGDEEDE